MISTQYISILYGIISPHQQLMLLSTSTTHTCSEMSTLKLQRYSLLKLSSKLVLCIKIIKRTRLNPSYHGTLIFISIASIFQLPNRYTVIYLISCLNSIFLNYPPKTFIKQLSKETYMLLYLYTHTYYSLGNFLSSTLCNYKRLIYGYDQIRGW